MAIVQDTGQGRLGRLFWLAKTIVILAFCLVGVLILIFAAIPWVLDAHGAPLSSVEQVQKGMHPEEVREILGAPDGSTQMENQTWWSYHRFLTWCHVGVVFSPDDLVLRTVHDH